MKRRPRRKGFLIRLLPFAVVGLVFGAIALICVIFMHAEALKWLFVPAVAGVFLLLHTVQALILQKREKEWIRNELGDELYFENFPRERKREERKGRKAANRADRK